MTDPVVANFSRKDDQILINLSKPLQVMRLDIATAVRWMQALEKLTNEAIRVNAGNARSTRREIDAFEESILGTPTLKES